MSSILSYFHFLLVSLNFLLNLKALGTPYNQDWMLHSGATDQMTSLPTHFSTYLHCPSNKKISTVDCILTATTSLCEDLHLPIAITKDTTTCTDDSLYPLSKHLYFEHLSPTHKAFLANLNTQLHLPLFPKHSQDIKWKKKKAMDLEMKAVEKNITLDIVSLPNGHKPVGCK